MINRLIDMSPSINKSKLKDEKLKSANASIADYAISFLEGMSETQRNRFKKMLENNIECGMSVAKTYGIDYKSFITEVKKILEVGV